MSLSELERRYHGKESKTQIIPRIEVAPQSAPAPAPAESAISDVPNKHSKKGIDFEVRDPKDINTYLQVEFSDVLAEPDSLRSVKCCWKGGFRCFECAKSCCYGFLTFFTGMCIALCWGCCFACKGWEIVWCRTPFLKLWHMDCQYMRLIWWSCVDCCCGPICETFGLCFARVQVKDLDK